MFEFFKNIYTSIRSYFNNLEKERAEKNYVYIANRLGELKTIRERLTPITYINATANEIVIEEAEGLLDKAKQLKKHGLYANFKVQEEDLRQKINKTKAIIAFTKTQRNLSLPQPFNYRFTRY